MVAASLICFVFQQWQIPPYQRLFDLYLAAVIALAVLIVLRVWWSLGLSSHSVRKLLDEAFTLVSHGGRSSASSLVQKLSSRSPEAGLHAWMALSPEGNGAAFRRMLGLADAHFRYSLLRLRTTAKGLLTLVGLTVLVIPAFIAVDIKRIVEEALQQEAVSEKALLAAGAETLDRVLVGIGVLVVLYLIYRYLERRLEVRLALWEHFRARVEAFEEQEAERAVE